jgi:hypothetical protein
MAEEVTTPPEGSEEHEGSTPKDQKVPYERFEEVNNRAKKASQELEELRSKLIEFEDRDKSEVERERAARERAESQLSDLMGKVTSLEKGAWVRSAAAELGFHDPEDAVTHLYSDLGRLEDQREAKRLVKQLASTKKHLVEQKDEQRPTPVSRVFAGEQTQPNGQNGNGQSPQASQAQRAAQAEQQFAEGLRAELAKFLPENSGNWYDAGSVT